MLVSDDKQLAMSDAINNEPMNSFHRDKGWYEFKNSCDVCLTRKQAGIYPNVKYKL